MKFSLLAVWDFASCCDEVSIIPDIPVLTFKALGYESEYLKNDGIVDKVDFFKKIKDTIDRGNRVIGFGITTKMPMSCLIVGYDDNGLYTRSYWPPEDARYDFDEYFYSTDWFENCSGFLLAGDKTGERLTGARAYAQIVKWAEYYCWRYKINLLRQKEKKSI